MRDSLLEVHLSAGYGKQQVLHDVQLNLHLGERLGLVGTSGAGKSTLLLALLGLLPKRGGWARGKVMIERRNLLTLSKAEARSLRGRVVSLVPQSPLSALNPALTLQTHFEAAWAAHRKRDRKLLSHRVAELAERVQLPSQAEFLKRRPGQISVGQAQRCALALALLHRPSLLIADEPTSALDPVTQIEVLDLLREASAQDRAALLFVSHDLLSVFRLCSGLAMLSAGRITENLELLDVPHTQDPELRRLLRALPLPAHLLVQHMQREDSLDTEASDQVMALTPSL